MEKDSRPKKNAGKKEEGGDGHCSIEPENKAGRIPGGVFDVIEGLFDVGLQRHIASGCPAPKG